MLTLWPQEVRRTGGQENRRTRGQDLSEGQRGGAALRVLKTGISLAVRGDQADCVAHCVLATQSAWPI